MKRELKIEDTPFEIQKKHLEAYLDIDEIEELKSHWAVVALLEDLFLWKDKSSDKLFSVSRETMSKYLKWDYTEKTHRKIINALFYLKTRIHKIVTMQKD